MGNPVKHAGSTEEADAPQRAAQSTNPMSVSTESMSSADELTQVRRLLFGAVVDEHNSRFEALETRLEASVTSLRETFDSQLSSLNARLDTQVTQLREELKKDLSASSNSHAETEKSLSATIDSTSESLKQQFESEIKSTAASLTAALSELKDTATARFDVIEKHVDENRETGEQVSEQLADGKLDRSALATLFASLSQQIDVLTPSSPQERVDSK